MNFINDVFQSNLADWCAGGPHSHGYTRAGPMIFLRKNVKLVSYRREMLSVDEVLAKNREEVERWHIAFMRGGKVDLGSHYYSEYLCPRYSWEESSKKMGQALHLLHNMHDGYTLCHPVFVADVNILDQSFGFFRFDGCHRAAAAHVLGIKEIPSLVFKAEEVL